MSPDPTAAPRRPRRSKSADLGSLVVAVLIGGLLGAAVLWFLSTMAARNTAPPHDPEAQPREVAPRSPFDPDEQEAISLFKDAKDCVVNVDTVLLVRRLDMRIEQQQAGTGSGFVWDDDGRVVTNFHVIRDAIVNRLSIRVVLADRSAWDARVVGAAPDYDLAVLQVPAPKDRLKKIKVGTSKDLEVGQKVYAIGNPFGLSLTLTKGIVSALDRAIESPGDEPIAGVIQVDAPINPGNSGGPLLDKDGRLIGVNTAIKSPSGGNVGIGFAIPVDTVNTVVPELIRSGKLFKPDIGVRLVDHRRLRRAGFPKGVMVQDVVPNGPAAKAGLRGVRVDRQTGDVQPGDLILAINGDEVKDNTEFERVLRALPIGGTAKLTIERDDRQLEIEVAVRGV
jgi:S1-C subfamily serine protease